MRDRQRRRRVRARGSPPSSPASLTFAIDSGDADAARRRRARGFDGTDFGVATRRTGSSCARRCPGASTSPTRSARSPSPAALGVDDATIAAALPHGRRAVPGRFEPVDEGQGFAVLVDYAHTPDSLENVLRAARDARRRARDRRLRRGRRPRPRQAPADGRGRRARWPTWRSSPPTTRAPRTRRRSSPRSSPGPAPGAERRASTAARRSSARSRSPAPGDVVVIAGKGHEQGQEFAGGRKVPFDDVAVAREALRARAGRLSGVAGGARARGSRVAARAADGPARSASTIDSREAGPGDLFVGLPGEHVDGGRFARAGARARARGASSSRRARADAARGGRGAVLAADDPLAALQAPGGRVAPRAGRAR